ncbi:MAG: HDOD domain-containing protein [Deferribacterota bacterium]|nr:HDOD domain-containing protein [Deferribacterota bacterium]
MNIHFAGSDKELNKLRHKLHGGVEFTSYEDADCVFLEISSREDFKKLPNKFLKPTYFYITNEDPALLKYTNGYNVKGTIYSFFNKNLILQRINLKTDKNRTLNRRKPSISIDSIYKKAESIPSLPTIASELINLTRDINAQMKKIVDTIKMDQGLASATLRLVNSPFYGLRVEINSIDRAAVLLGFRNLAKLAVAISFRQFYTKNFSIYNTTGIRLWMHSFNVARIAESIASLNSALNIQSIYLAGLLHDIGKIVLVDFLYTSTKSIEDEAKQTGFNHAEVGSILLKKWNIAPQIVDAVTKHHHLTDNIFNLTIYYSNIIERKKKLDSSIIDEVSNKIGADNNLLKEKIQNIKSSVM